MTGWRSTYVPGIALAAAFVLPLAAVASHERHAALDRHFGDNGVVVAATAPGAGPDYQNGIAIQRDGKIVVGGESDAGDAGGFRWRLTRYTRDGRPDRKFGTNGTVVASMSSVGGFDERMVSVAVQRDGKIVAAGFVLTGPDTQNSALARFNPDGTLDASFGNSGVVVTDVASEPAHDFINQVLIDDRGRIVVAGGCVRMFVARYLADGSLDPSFNAAGPVPGIAITEVATAGETNAEILGLALDHQGRIVGSGYATYDNGSFQVDSAVVRFRPDGTLDPSFNPTGPRPGTVITPIGPDWNVAFRVAIDHAGRIVTAGDAFVGVGNGLYDVALARYDPDGTLDESFGDDGKVIAHAGPGDSDDDAQGLAILPGGAIVVGGSAAPTAFTFDSDFMVLRFENDGGLDEKFGDDGIAVTPTAPGTADDEIYSTALQDEDKFVAAGECDQPATGRDVCVARYDVADAD